MMIKNRKANFKSCLKLSSMLIMEPLLTIMDMIAHKMKIRIGISIGVLMISTFLILRTTTFPKSIIMATSGSQVKDTGIKPSVLNQSAKNIEKIMIKNETFGLVNKINLDARKNPISRKIVSS
jgi:uridylate kinase